VPVHAFIDESETTLMAQKQKVKIVAKAVKQGVAKAAAAKATTVKSKGAQTSAVKTAKFAKVVVKKPVASAAKAAPVKAGPVKAAPIKTTAKAPVKAASAKKPAAVAKPAPAQAVKSTSSASTQAMAAKIQMKANARNSEAAKAAAPAVQRPAQPAQRAVPAAIGKPSAQKITAPMPAVAAMTPKALAEKAVAARAAVVVPAVPAAPKKPVSARHGFKTNEFVVYPAHGVGRIVGIEEQEIAGMSLELFVITFDKEKLTLRVPTGKLASIGMRKLAEEGVVKRAMETLKGRARVKRTMWSRRAQEYVAKINSGDLISIAEVVRDLYRSEAQPEQSYSERQLYENALERMARELAAVEKMDERGAVQRIVEILSKSAKGRRLAAEGADAGDNDIKAA
jgi:CarD family transcriptional regulator